MLRRLAPALRNHHIINTAAPPNAIAKKPKMAS
jgi:hypothetical protein